MSDSLTQKHQISLEAILYIITMSIAFATRHGYLGFGSTIQLVIGMLWVFVALFKLLRKKFNRKDVLISETLYFLRIIILPQVVIHLFFFVQVILGMAALNQFTLNLTTYIPCLLGVLSVYLFKDKAVRYTVISMIIAWVVSVLSACIGVGFYIIKDAILEAYVSNYYKHVNHLNYLELHDLVLAVGYCVLFFFLVHRGRISRRNALSLVCVTAIMFLGIKRIAILALVVISVYMILTKRFKYRTRYRINLSVGYMLIVTAYFFIFVISMINSSAITDIAAKIGIDTRGRLYYYNAVMSLGEFSPLYFGIGRNMVSAHLTDEFSYLRISAPHSDILKIYIEGGFIVFGWWLWYTLVHITKKLKQKYSISVSNVYFILGMYTFILNLTDNVDTYFVCRILPIQIVMVVALFGSDRLIWKRLLGK